MDMLVLVALERLLGVVN